MRALRLPLLGRGAARLRALLAACALAAAPLLTGCFGANDATAPGDRPTVGRVALAASIVGATRADPLGLRVLVEYVRAGGDAVVLGEQTVALTEAATQEVPITIDLARCLDDDGRRGADLGSGAGGVCYVRLTLSLLTGERVLDTQTVGPMVLRPGGTVTPTAPLALFAVSTVTVRPASGEAPPAGTPYRLALGQTLALTAVVLDAGGQPVADRPVRWRTDAPTVVRVDSLTGTVAPLAPGRARVIATAGGRDAAVDVAVVPAPAPIIVSVAGGVGSGRVTSAPAGIDCTVTAGAASGTCAFTFPGDALVTLTAAPSTGSSFATWGGDCTAAAGALTCELTSSVPRSATVTFTAFRALSVTLAGAGAGAVTSAPAGVDCRRAAGNTTGACTAPFLDGASVTLTAAPDAGSMFAGWSGGACGGTAPTCTLALSEARAVTATFALRVVTLTLTLGGSGAGTVTATAPAGGPGVVGDGVCTLAAGSGSASCALAVETGAPVTLTAAAGPTSTFGGWGGACAAASAGAPCTLTVTESVSAGAVFTLRPVGLSVAPAAGNAGAGTVATADRALNCAIGGGTTSGPCAADLPVGTSVTLTATPAAEQTFLGWGGDCAQAGMRATCTLTLRAATAVTARFGPPQSVAVTPRGVGGGRVAGGAINCVITGGDPSGTCTATGTFGAVVTLTATADSASAFAGWGGDCSGTGACTVTLDRARAVTAEFTRRTVTVTLALGGAGAGTVAQDGATVCTLAGGAGSSTCTRTVPAFAAVTFTATAASGSLFQGWAGPCAGTGTCTLAPGADVTVGATFVPAPVGVSVSADARSDGGGTVVSTPSGVSCTIAGTGTSGSCSTTFAVGTAVTLTAAANADNAFLGWGGACAEAGTAATCTFTVRGPTGVTARFAARRTLSVAPGGTGGGRVTGGPIACVYDGEARSGPCSAELPYAANVTLAAAADSASTFAGWGGACSGTGPCTVSMTEARNVTATFARRTVTVTLALSGAGGGTVTQDGTVVCTLTAGAGSSSCTRTVPAFAAVTFTAAANGGSLFGGWAGACTGTGACTVAPGADVTVGASFTPAPVGVSVTADGRSDGGGAVASAPAGIACTVVGTGTSGTCSTTFAVGSTVTLTATPNQGDAFLGWGGACAAAGTASTCSLTVGGPTAVTVRFAGPRTLTVTPTGVGGRVTGGPIACVSNGLGGATGTCTASLAYGTAVSLTAAGDSGNVFTGWGGACSGTGPCTVTMTEARAVTAAFARRTVTVTLALGGAGAGTVSQDGATVCTLAAGAGSNSCTRTVPAFASVTFTAAAASGSTFQGWSGPCAGTGACTLSPGGDVTVGASFTPAPVGVSVAADSRSDGNGTVTSAPSGVSCSVSGTSTSGACTAAFAVGSTVTLTAAPSGGVTFLGWGGDCASAGSSTTCTLTVGGPAAATVRFAGPRPLAVTPAGSGGGAISGGPIACAYSGGSSSGTCAANLAFGATVTLSATADSASTFAGWGGACSGTGPCTVTMTEARSVTATFTRRTVTVTLALSGAGGGSVSQDGAVVCTLATGGGSTSCTRTVNAFAAVTFTATPNGSSRFDGWSGACSGTGPCTLAPGSNVTLGASFVPAPSAVTVSADAGSTGNGSVASSPSGIACTITGTSSSGTCTSTFLVGSSVTLTATPASGARFVAWTGACAASTGPTCTFTVGTSAVNTAVRFAPTSAVLTLAGDPAGTGQGQAFSTDENLSCSINGGSATGTCSATYSPVPRTVVLRATHDAANDFEQWSGVACDEGNTSDTCTITLTASVTARARFRRLPTAAVTVTPDSRSDGNGTVTSAPSGVSCTMSGDGTFGTCSDNFVVGSSVTLTAAAATSNAFLGWGGACASAGTASTCTFTVSGATAVTARFAGPRRLTVTPSGAGGARITGGPIDCTYTGTGSSGTCAADVAYGASVTLSATPDGTSIFGGWGGACTGTGGCTVSMTEARTVTATFTRRIVSVTAASGTTAAGRVTTASPPGLDCLLPAGTGTCSGPAPAGTAVTFSASPTDTAVFGGWSNLCAGENSLTCVRSVPAGGGTATARFDRGTGYDLVLRSFGRTRIRGSVAVSTAGRRDVAYSVIDDSTRTFTPVFRYGTTITFTAAAPSGYVFEGWGGACSSVETNPTCTLTNWSPAGRGSVTAFFSPLSAVQSRAASAPAAGPAGRRP